MGMKIYSIELKDQEIVQVDGTEEFIATFKNKKQYPVFLTNYSLSKGHDMGLLKSSLLSDLLKLESVTKLDSEREQAEMIMQSIDEQKMLKVIYLAFKGANPSVDLSLDEFLQKYHANYQEKLELYMNIISAAIDSDSSAFAKGLKDSTQKIGTTEKK